MLTSFLGWWYVSGWSEAFAAVRTKAHKVALNFSIPVLATTLFSPWKQIVSVPGESIDTKFRALLDNLFSRCIGFVVRLSTLIVAMIAVAVSWIVGLTALIAWPFMPLVLIYCLIKVIIG